jgi:phosphoribosylanthranilate isomerase
MTFVKICGLRTVEHAVAAVEAGADLLGFIFAPARRQVSPAQAAAIGAVGRAAAAAAGRRVSIVGVFVNETPERMVAIARECDLDVLQLSGDEDIRIVARLPGQSLFKAVRLNDAPQEREWLRSGPWPNVRLLVDAHVHGSYGGAGVVADWNRAATLVRQRPTVLAGGLHPGNVGDAIRQVQPWGVDVSSGVETEGAKDVAKIQAFVAAVRAADEQLATAHTAIG